MSSPCTPRLDTRRGAHRAWNAAVAAAFALTAAAAWAGGSPQAARKTVCTITVNSPDEKEVFRKYLSPDTHDFVELVEHGRSDWLESACRTGVRCDMLVISGHYDGGNEFFSDRTEAREHLPVDELERVSCGESCPGLFSQLKEVYLFGCNTLNAEANTFPSAEIGRSLVRAGHSRATAERMTRAIAQRHAESSKDRMRLVFRDVPAIYGFSSVAPLGPSAGAILRRHLESGGTSEVATGRASARLVQAFSAHAMTVTSGMTEGDRLAAHRRDVCQFADAGKEPARKVAFVHQLLERDAAEARMFLPRLERFVADLDASTRADTAVGSKLAAIAADTAARDRFLDLARDADAAAVRARMVAVAQGLGWLDAQGAHDELVRMWTEQLDGNAIGPAEVDLACTLNATGSYDGAIAHASMTQSHGQAALLACLGDLDAREHVLRALTSPDERAASLAQAYVRHRPVDDGAEWRDVIADIESAPATHAQVRALQALSSQRVSDPEVLKELVRLYPLTESVGAQTAIAGILLRADYASIASPEVVATLRERRVAGTVQRQDAIDVLLRRLESP